MAILLAIPGGVLVDVGWGHHSWGWGWLTMIAWWGVIAVGVVLLVRHFSRGDGVQPGRPSARAILEERFARGEIDGDEFRDRLAVLERGE